MDGLSGPLRRPPGGRSAADDSGPASGSGGAVQDRPAALPGLARVLAKSRKAPSCRILASQVPSARRRGAL